MAVVYAPCLGQTIRTQDRLSAGYHALSGTTGLTSYRGWKLQASLAGAATLETAWLVPDPLPAGDLRLRFWYIANATTGTVSLVARWGMFDPSTGADPSGLTLVSEAASSLTWSSTSANKLRQGGIALDGATPAAGQVIVCNLEFQVVSSGKLAVPMTFNPFVIWA